MRTTSHSLRLGAFAAFAISAGLVLGLELWPQPEGILAFCGLLLTAIVMLTDIGLAPAGESRILDVKVLPVVNGVTLLWYDVTERRRTEHALQRSADRLAFAADGANDALWEWNFRTQEFYFSARWR